MDTKAQLHALFHLQQLDSALDALKKAYAALDQGVKEHAVYESAKAAHTDAETELHRVTTALRDTELEQKSVEAKKAEYETKLYSGKIRIPKELQAMQEEVEMLGRQCGRLDEKILTLMDELEAARKREVEAKQALNAAVTAFKTKRAAYKQDAETMAAQARVLADQRAEAIKPIPPNLLKRYETLRASKGGIAIARLEDGNACGGCRMGLGSALVTLVRRGDSLEICDNCGRILCDAEATH